MLPSLGSSCLEALAVLVLVHLAPTFPLHTVCPHGHSSGGGWQSSGEPRIRELAGLVMLVP